MLMVKALRKELIQVQNSPVRINGPAKCLSLANKTLA